MAPAVSPYVGLGARAFWKTGVVESAYPPPDLYRPRWALDRKDKIVTAGSCFAQHVGRALRKAGFQVVDTEPASSDPRDLGERAAEYGYGLYSARYGNVYTVRQLSQLLAEAHGGLTPGDVVWEKDGRYYDALRPNTEPAGFASAKEVLKARKAHLAAVRVAFAQADVFVFTMGLTEAWTHKVTGQVYPVAPGVLAGMFDPDLHVLRNFRLADIRADFDAVLGMLAAINPRLRVLLTVSPVPLTATATGEHVLVATTYAKSVLRACAGDLCADNAQIDYFPSYEIVTSTKAAGHFFEPNLRSVSAAGVASVMRAFLAAHGQQVDTAPCPPDSGGPADDDTLRQQRKAARKAARRIEKGKTER